jgi:hypothetical protein
MSTASALRGSFAVRANARASLISSSLFSAISAFRRSDFHSTIFPRFSRVCAPSRTIVVFACWLAVLPQPIRDHLTDLFESDLGWFQLQFPTKRREVRLKALAPVEHVLSTRQFRTLGRCGKPCSQLSYRGLHVIAVRVDVLSSDVGDEDLIAVWIRIEDQRHFVTLKLASVSLATEKQSEFQRHVEAGEFMLFVELDGRYVVDSVLALLDDALNLREPELSTVVFFPRGACHEAQVGDREHDRIKYRFVALVKRAVHENLIAWANHAEAAGSRRADLA